jgi:hypothetical protein
MLVPYELTFSTCFRLAEVAVLFDFIIIIIRHESGLTRPVSASSNSFFEGLSSRLPLFCL